MTMYQITAARVPTFHLNSHILGIVDAEHAARIAESIINTQSSEGYPASIAVSWSDDEGVSHTKIVRTEG